MTTKSAILRFFSAQKFAVVGASTNPLKNGNKALNYLLALHRDVVPVNPNASEIQGIACLTALSKLADPKNTAVSIVVPPKVTLEILKEAKALNVFGLWLQPGAEDDAVVKFIQGDTQLAARCIYTKQPASQATGSTPKLAGNATEDIVSPCLWTHGPSLNPSPAAPTVTAAAIEVPTVKMSAPVVGASPTLEQKEALFLSAPHFAVVGASTSESKNGTKALKWLIKESKDVIPVNLIAQEIQGIKCMKSLSELPDPTHTSVSIVVPPKTTLAVLQLAKSLGIYSVWIQPGAEDDAVVEFIEADAQFKARCIYREHALHTVTPKILASTLHTDTTGPCLFRALPSSPAAPVATAAALASNIVAGVKHALSPPSTPPAAKSLKLSADSTTDLGEEIPGLA